MEALESLLAEHPELAGARLDSPGAWLRDQIGDALDGFFQAPFLLWFVAEDPVRNGRLPQNVGASARAIVRAARSAAPETLEEQLEGALQLVSWSWIARECGVQIDLIDALLDAGASPDGNPDRALVNRNRDAAEHLVARGARLTLGTAFCLERWDEASPLFERAGAAERRFALVLSALNGRAAAVRRLLAAGVDPNEPCAELFPHGTPLHHAVCSGDLATVAALVEGGADPAIRDTAWEGTPLDWAEHYGNEELAEFLRGRGR